MLCGTWAVQHALILHREQTFWSCHEHGHLTRTACRVFFPAVTLYPLPSPRDYISRVGLFQCTLFNSFWFMSWSLAAFDPSGQHVQVPSLWDLISISMLHNAPKALLAHVLMLGGAQSMCRAGSKMLRGSGSTRATTSPWAAASTSPWTGCVASAGALSPLSTYARGLPRARAGRCGAQGGSRPLHSMP